MTRNAPSWQTKPPSAEAGWRSTPSLLLGKLPDMGRVCVARPTRSTASQNVTVPGARSEYRGSGGLGPAPRGKIRGSARIASISGPWALMPLTISARVLFRTSSRTDVGASVPPASDAFSARAWAAMTRTIDVTIACHMARFRSG